MRVDKRSKFDLETANLEKVRQKQYARSAVSIAKYLSTDEYYLRREQEEQVGEVQKGACSVLNYYIVCFTGLFEKLSIDLKYIRELTRVLLDS